MLLYTIKRPIFVVNDAQFKILCSLFRSFIDIKIVYIVNYSTVNCTGTTILFVSRV